MSKQAQLFSPDPTSYGGQLRKKSNGRGARPISTRNSMHLVLRSSKATQLWSFKRPENERAINQIVGKFSQKHGVRILSLANVGNHLHFHLQFSSRHTYKKWIRAITSAIAMRVTGISRWTGAAGHEKFWNLRPFSKIVRGTRHFANLRDYILINVAEGMGRTRAAVRWMIADRDKKKRERLRTWSQARAAPA